MDRAMAFRGAAGARADGGCMDSGPISVDEPCYRSTDAIQHTGLVGLGRCSCYDCIS